jgi:hypothetical protein
MLALQHKRAQIILTSLIPSLNCSSNRIEDDQHVENSRMLPLVRDFLVENASFIVIQLLDLINMVWTLCYQGAFDKIGPDVVEVVVSGELFDIGNQLRLGNSGERILDSATGQY